MRCEQARERWHASLEHDHRDGDLDRHVAECAACREYVAQMEALLGALRTLRQETEPVGSSRYTERPTAGRRHAAEVPRGGAWRFGLDWTAVAAAAALALAVGGSWLLAPHRHPPLPDGSQRVVRQSDTQPPREEPAVPPTRAGITLRGESAEAFMVVAAPTRAPDVQMYWLYPTLEDPRTSNGS